MMSCAKAAHSRPPCQKGPLKFLFPDESQVSALAAEIGDEEIEAKRIFRDPYRNVIYLELSKK